LTPPYLSLAFLFGIAAQFRAMDGCSFLRRILASIEPTLGLLYAVSLVTFVFSPFILTMFWTLTKLRLVRPSRNWRGLGSRFSCSLQRGAPCIGLSCEGA